MIEKPNEHEINRTGKRLLREAVEHLGWVVNDVQEDYSIDSNVRMFDGQSPNGAWFHVQLKSTENPSYSADRTFISHSLRLDHARHFALELRQPMFLIIADITTKQVYWTCPQLDRRLLNQLQITQGNESITVRIPTAQRLPATAPSLLSALYGAYMVLANRELAAGPMVQFVESLEYSSDPGSLYAGFQDKSDVLKLKRIAALATAGNEAAACERAEALLRDPGASTETKFWASIQLSNIQYSILVTSGKPQNTLYKHRLDHAKKLQKLVKTGPEPFKFYALVNRRAAELESLAYENFSLGMLQKAHLQKGGDPFLVLTIYARRAWLWSARLNLYQWR